jgi:hypothetical protein
MRTNVFRKRRSGRRSRRRTFAIVIGAIVLETAVMRLRGYPVGGKVVVRCQRGHLFTTIWIPGASLKSIRLGWRRFQHCPVGNHWSIVTPVKEAELTEEGRRIAHGTQDIRIP